MSLDPVPLLAVDHPGDEVEEPGPVAALVVVGVVGGAVVAQDAHRLVVALPQFAGAERLEAAEHVLPRRTHVAVGGEHFVEGVRRRAAAG